MAAHGQGGLPKAGRARAAAPDPGGPWRGLSGRRGDNTRLVTEEGGLGPVSLAQVVGRADRAGPAGRASCKR